MILWIDVPMSNVDMRNCLSVCESFVKEYWSECWAIWHYIVNFITYPFIISTYAYLCFRGKWYEIEIEFGVEIFIGWYFLSRSLPVVEIFSGGFWLLRSLSTFKIFLAVEYLRPLWILVWNDQRISIIE